MPDNKYINKFERGYEMELRDCLKTQFFEKFGHKPLCFIKFTEKREYAEDILNGCLYVNPIKKFREIEEQQLSKGQGDSSEVKSILNCQMIVKEESTGIDLLRGSGNLIQQYENDANRPVFCIVGLKASELKVFDYNETSITFSFQSENFNLEQMKKEFGGYAVIIHSDSFSNAILKALQNHPNGGFFKEVIYSHQNLEERIDAFENQSEDRFLYKDLEFSHQKEWRLVLNELVNGAKYFKIGSLSDFAEIVEVDKLPNLNLIFNYRY